MTQPNRLTMNQALLKLLDANTGIWNALNAFAKARPDLETSVIGRDKSGQTQSIPITGVTKGKESDIELAVKLVTGLARNASAYALEVRDYDLFRPPRPHQILPAGPAR